MKDRDRALLSKIEQAILDDNVTTTSILQKCIILGGQAGSTKLRDWAAKELRGYGPDDEVPPYRRIVAPIYIDGQAGPSLIRGQLLPSEKTNPRFADLTPHTEARERNCGPLFQPSSPLAPSEVAKNL